MIFAVPVATAVTTPFATVATEALSVFHVTFWFVAFAGAIVSVRVPVLPTVRLSDVGLTLTPVTETGPDEPQ